MSDNPNDAYAEMKQNVTDPSSWAKTYKNPHNKTPLDLAKPLKFLFVGFHGAGKSSTINTLFRSLNPASRWQVTYVGAGIQNHGTYIYKIVNAFTSMDFVDTVGLERADFENKTKIIRVACGRGAPWKNSDDPHLAQFSMENQQTLDGPTDAMAVVVGPSPKTEDLESLTKFLAHLKSTQIPFIVIQTNAKTAISNLDNLLNIDYAYFFKIENYSQHNSQVNVDTEAQTYQILNTLIGLAVDSRTTTKHKSGLKYYYTAFAAEVPGAVALFQESRNSCFGYGHIVICVAFFVFVYLIINLVR